MKRQVVFDTETTGTEINGKGDRLIEIAAVEIIDRKITGRTYVARVNPEGRKIHPKAFEVHGISDEEVANAPLFKHVVGEFLEFVRGAELIAHNADFDEKVINHELKLINHPKTFWEEVDSVTDTLVLSRRLYAVPRAKHKLDDLIERYGVDGSQRTKHGALIDCQLLAQVYLKMTEGVNLEQDSLEKDVARTPVVRIQRPSATLLVVNPNEEEQHNHRQYVQQWRENREKAGLKEPIVLDTMNEKSDQRMRI